VNLEQFEDGSTNLLVDGGKTRKKGTVEFNGWSDQLQGVGTFSAKAHALATPKTRAYTSAPTFVQ
jgi:hypothetical protein